MSDRLWVPRGENRCLKPSHFSSPWHDKGEDQSHYGVGSVGGWVLFLPHGPEDMDLEPLTFSDLAFLGWEVVVRLSGHMGWEELKSGDLLGLLVLITTHRKWQLDWSLVTAPRFLASFYNTWPGSAGRRGAWQGSLESWGVRSLSGCQSRGWVPAGLRERQGQASGLTSGTPEPGRRAALLSAFLIDWIWRGTREQGLREGRGSPAFVKMMPDLCFQGDGHRLWANPTTGYPHPRTVHPEAVPTGEVTAYYHRLVQSDPSDDPSCHLCVVSE